MNYYIPSKMESNKSKNHRFIELDLLRGFAISCMVFFHIIWDLDYFGILQLNKTMYNFNVFFQVLFLTLVGITLSIKNNRIQDRLLKSYNNVIYHGLWIFSLGMIITTVTLLFMPDRPVIFGILHCIGLSIVLSTLFLRFKTYNLLFGFSIIFIGLIIGHYNLANPTFIHLMIGLHQTNVWKYTIDYFPLLPWFGVSLIGIGVGNILYRDNKRSFKIPNILHYRPVTLISWIGKHSLLIYLFHQPLIAGVLFLFLLF